MRDPWFSVATSEIELHAHKDSITKDGHPDF